MVESPQDLIEIRNIDTNCVLPDPYVHPNNNTQFFQISYRNPDNTKIPYQIEAGKTRIFPRYLANYIIKHLTDHVLISRKLGINDRSRKEVENEILVSVVEAYGANYAPIPVANTNARPDPTGELPPLMEDPNGVPEKVNNSPTFLEDSKPKETVEEIKEKPTRSQLFKEARELGIETSPKDTVDSLMKKIQDFAGVKK